IDDRALLVREPEWLRICHRWLDQQERSRSGATPLRAVAAQLRDILGSAVLYGVNRAVIALKYQDRLIESLQALQAADEGLDEVVGAHRLFGGRRWASVLVVTAIGRQDVRKVRQDEMNERVSTVRRPVLLARQDRPHDLIG